MNLEELLKSDALPKKGDPADEDLFRLFMKYKGLLKKQERDKAFWAATNENLNIAYQKLERRTAELKAANVQLQQEVADRKRAEGALRESEERYRTLVENLPIGVYRNTPGPEGEFLTVNKALLDIFGFESEDELEKVRVAGVYMNPDERKEFSDNLLSKGRVTGSELRLKKKDGTLIWGSVTARVMYDESGQAAYFDCTLEDITEHKQAEEALRESEKRYRTLISQMLNGFAFHEIILDETGKPCDYRFLEINKAFEEMTGLSAAQVIGKTVLEVLPNLEPYWIEIYGQVALTGNPVQFENYSRALGKYFEVLAYCPKEGQFATVFTNITERIQTERQLKLSLRERDILLREIHHRVKNNMQIITSLLKLQAKSFKDKRVQEALMDIHGRVQAMALVHEALYQSEPLAAIDFKRYISGLTRTLFQVYGTDLGRVRLKVQAEGVKLGLEKAVLLGLIINELVSNSLKYAFPDKSEGEIKIGARYTRQNEIELAVEDNGAGFPRGLDWRNTETLGLQIVLTLIEDQLEGTMDLDLDGGTRFFMRFKA